ncbi:MAG: sialidase [Clostridium sp.]
MGFKEDQDAYFINPKYGFCLNSVEEEEGENMMNLVRDNGDKKNPVIKDGEFTSKDLLRASAFDVNRILNIVNVKYPESYSILEKYKVNKAAARYIFSLAIAYGIDNKNRYSGDDEKKAKALARDFYTAYNQVLLVTMIVGLPSSVMREVLEKIMYITVQNSNSPNPPIPKPPIHGRWSGWEDLGGILTSAPAACSFAKNRIDVFARGTDKAMWHKWWNGRWSGWENLSGVLESAPAACSFSYNRIDTFVRGTDDAMYHKWWNGDRWSSWESLGGSLTSAPAACSFSYNRIDTFVRGTDNAMWHKWWDGEKWSTWESLGGKLTSAPAACSFGPNRIDTFVRGTDNAMWHKWWDGSNWSGWESLGGRLTSAPCATSTEPNKIDCFARGENNQLIWKRWDGYRWSPWESLGGFLKSGPTACSWGRERIDVFAKGGNDQLWHIFKG